MSNAHPHAAVLTKASGYVSVERQGQSVSLAEGDAIFSTDTVITDNTATAEVRFLDGSTATLSPASTLEVRDFAFGEGVTPSFILNLAQGTMRSVSGEVVKQNPDAFKIVTPQATVGIRGTELFTAVQPDGQEVHAVLHIGKDHIVVITGNDGQSVVMDQALQAVNMQNGAAGMQKQTFTLTEMQQVIKAIAPSQVQKPLLPQDPQSPQEGAEAAQPAEAIADTAAPAAPASGPSGMVIITYESEAQMTAASAESAVNVNTLIRVVESLQGALADAGFSVQVGMGESLVGNLSDSLGTSSSVLGDAVLDGTFVLTPILPPVLDTGDGGGAGDAGGPLPQVHVFNGNYSGNWQTEFGASMDSGRPQHITINGNVLGTSDPLMGKVVANANPGADNAVLSSDVISVQGVLDGARVIGDCETLIASGSNTVLGNDSVSFTNLENTIASSTKATFISGDVVDFSLASGGTLTFGNDVMTGDSMGTNGIIYGDASNITKGTTTWGTVNLGNDTITVGNMSNGARIFGDMRSEAMGSHSYTGGHDTITVNGSMTDDSRIDGGMGNDTITVGTVNTTTLSAGVKGGVYGEQGDDIIKVGTLKNGIVDGGAGNDTITIDTMEWGTVFAGAGQDHITIKDMAYTNTKIDLFNGTAARTYDFGDYNSTSGVFTATFTDGSTLTLSGAILSGVTGSAEDVMNRLLGGISPAVVGVIMP